MVLHLSHGISLSTYDAMVHYRFHAEKPDPRLLIVDIDEASLARMGREFGQWPWPRDTLATVLDYLERQRPAAIVWDLVFSDPDRASPGGDAAFDASVLRSRHSHFSVIRLSPDEDGASSITSAQLPGLWVERPPERPGAMATSTVAVIPPALPGVAAARLGFNNGYVDTDGVLRRFRYAEKLADGRLIQSLPLSVESGIAPGGYDRAVQAFAQEERSDSGELISWRATANIYPRVSFADLFAAAQGQVPLKPLPSFEGKVLVIGATAPSLHDVHATSLSVEQHGVETLATVIDNALGDRHLRELPRGFQAVLACVLFAGVAAWVRAHGVSSLRAVTLVVPAVLLAISYLSLNLGYFFLDLRLAAGLALLYLAALQFWGSLQRDYWLSLPEMESEKMAAWAILGHSPWIRIQLDSLFTALQAHAPDCRVVATEPAANWSNSMRWADLARVAAVIGPAQSLEPAVPALREAIADELQADEMLVELSPASGALFSAVFEAWASLYANVLPPPPPLSKAKP